MEAYKVWVVNHPDSILFLGDYRRDNNEDYKIYI